MSEQVGLFDPVAGEARKRRGTESVLEHAPCAWTRSAWNLLCAYAASGEPFSADDLVRNVGLPPDRNAVGALFHHANQQGVIVKAGWATGQRPEQRGRAIRLWRGTGKKGTNPCTSSN